MALVGNRQQRALPRSIGTAAMAGLLHHPALSPPTLQSRGHLPRRPIFSPRHSPSRPLRQSAIRSSSSATSSAPLASPTSGSTDDSLKTMKLTYLEFNGWLWELPGGFRVLVDPILVGNLDFGIPWLFDAAKKRLRGDAAGPGVQDLKDAVDLLLITQSLDDHCHVRTLTQLSAAAPGLPVVTTPNARPIVSGLPFRDVTYLEPGESTTAGGPQGIKILATAGPVLGPPWQRPENGYIVTAAASQEGAPSLYYEPHCVYDGAFLRDRGLRADVLITPVVKQLLPANFTLVSGKEDAVELARLLRPSYVVPMCNGEFDAKGLLTAVIKTEGTTQDFKALLAEALPQAQVLDPTPGVPLQIEFNK